MGIWDVNPDGSGTWTRVDSAKTRFCGTRKCGPTDAEVTHRETYDDQTGQLIATHQWPNIHWELKKDVLPEPYTEPRRLRTVFHFAATKIRILPTYNLDTGGGLNHTGLFLVPLRHPIRGGSAANV